MKSLTMRKNVCMSVSKIESEEERVRGKKKT